MNTHHTFAFRFAVTVLLVLGHAPAFAAGAAATKPPGITNTAWARIVMIGASATAGFTVTEPLGGTNTQLLRLDRYLDAALAAPHEAVRNLGNAMFFLQPELMGPRQVEKALETHPTLVVGADFLFWFCYGEGTNDAHRLQRFDYGLKLLESITCPLVLGDLPDASAAVGVMLSAEQMPSVAALTAANRRLKEWVAQRPQVVLLPLSNFVHSAMANQPIQLHDRTLPAGKTRALVQFDKLHPSPQGCATLALGIVDVLQKAKPAQFAGPIHWDPAEVLRLALAPRPALAPPPTKALPAAK